MMSYIRAERFYYEIGNEIPIAFNLDEKLNTSGSGMFRAVLIRKGIGILCVDDRRFSLVAPAVLCINEKENVTLQESTDLEAQAVYFHPSYVNGGLTFDKIRGIEKEEIITGKQDIFLFEPFVARDAYYNGLLYLDSATMSSISRLFCSVKNQVEDQAHRFWSCCARSYFMELLFAFVTIRQSPEHSVNINLRQSTQLADQVILYLNSNYGKKITIPELCQMFHTNKTSLQEQFRLSTGQSVAAYLIAFRVRLASLMLKNTTLSVTEISERLGFSDNAHFNKMFRKTTGFSPMQYRKQFAGMK